MKSKAIHKNIYINIKGYLPPTS